MLDQFLMMMEIKRASKRVQRISYHLGRCKKDKDKIKLYLMITCDIRAIEKLYLTVNDSLKDTISLLVKTCKNLKQHE